MSSPFELESLEPRLLLSASPAPVPAPNVAPPAVVIASTAPPNDHSATGSNVTVSSDNGIKPFEGVLGTDLVISKQTGPVIGPQRAEQTSPGTNELQVPVASSPAATDNANAAPNDPSFIDPGNSLDTTSIAEQLTETLHAANGPPEGSSAVHALDASDIKRPLILVPGVAGSFPTDDLKNTWYLNLGILPVQNGVETMKLDPIAGFYNDIVTTLTNVGYDNKTAGQRTLFLATYDWRLNPGPLPANDSQIDGKIDGVTDASVQKDLSGPAYPFAVDYLVYWAQEAVKEWKQGHGGKAPEGGVDIIAHSMGGIVARVYLQSSAYQDGGLPQVNNLVMIGVPERGASKTWNIINDNWASDIAYQLGLSKIVNSAYNAVWNGDGQTVIKVPNPDGTIATIDKNLLGKFPDERSRHLGFISAYLPGATALLPTYDFLQTDPKNSTNLSNINSNATLRNSLVLDLNDGMDLFYKPSQLDPSKNYTYTAAGSTVERNPNRFLSEIGGKLILIYTNVASTPTTVVKETGSIVGGVIGLAPTLGSIAEFNVFLKARGPNFNETWYQDVDKDVGGDGTVPTQSSIGSLMIGTTWVSTNIVAVLITETGPSQVLDHTGMVASHQTQQVVLQKLAINFVDSQISQGQSAGPVEKVLNLAKFIGFDPSETQAAALALGIPEWENIGPDAIQNGSAVTSDKSNLVAGAIQTIAIDPNHSNIALAGSVNGGIWRTENFQTDHPEWFPVTDDLKAVSITTIVFSRALPGVAYAGTGTSSSTSLGLGLGLLYSTDDGQHWKQFAGSIGGMTVTALLPTGVTAATGSTATSAESEVLMFSLKGAKSSNNFAGGVFLSTDRSSKIKRITEAPSGDVTDLAMALDPENTIYAGVSGIQGQGGGVWRAKQNGASLWDTWTDTQVAQANTIFGRLRFATYTAQNKFVLYVGDVPGVSRGDLAGLYRFDTKWVKLLGNSSGSTAQALDPPLSGNRNLFSIVVDPGNENHVFLGGTNYPGTATGYIAEGRLTGTDPTDPAQWDWKQTAVGADAGGTSPHADSRQMIFYNSGPKSLIEVDDGGVYELLDPGQSDQQWFSKNGSLSVSEVLSIAYDSQNHTVLAGLQDNGYVVLTGTTTATAGDQYEWLRLGGGDGGEQAIGVAGSSASYYTVGNNFSFIYLRTLNKGALIADAAKTKLALAATSSGAAPLSGLSADDKSEGGFIRLQFAVDPFKNHHLVLGYNDLYESGDFGATITKLNEDAPRGSPVTALAFGGRNADGSPNDDVIYAARGRDLLLRSQAGQTLRKVFTFGGTIQDIVLDPGDWRTAYVVTSANVWMVRISDQGKASAVKITGTLKDSGLQTIELVPVGGNKLVLVGGSNGVFQAWNPQDNSTKWTPVGAGLPRVQVTDLKYDPVDKILLAATLGRGIWRIDNAPTVLTSGAVWFIYGTPGNDSITVNRRADDPTRLQASVNGQALPEVPFAGVARIEILGGDGNDDLVLDLTNGLINVPSGIHFDGGSGTNTWSIKGPVPTSLNETGNTVTVTDGTSRQVFLYDRASKKQSLASPRSNVAQTVTAGAGAASSIIFGRQTLSEQDPGIGPFDNLAVSVATGPTGRPIAPTADPEGGPDEGNDSSGDAESSLLERLVQAATDNLSLEDLGAESATAEQLRAALDALDSTGGNVSVSETGTATVFDVHINRSLSTETNISIDSSLGGGAIQIQGSLQISADVAVHLILGVDDQGFFITPNDSSDPEVVISNISVSGSVEGDGRFGFLGVTLSDAKITADPALKLTAKLHAVGDNSTDNIIRLDDLTYADPGLLSIALVGNPNADDLVLTGTFSVGPLGDDNKPAFTLLDSEVDLRWADINKPDDVKVEAKTAAGSALLNFLTINPTEILNQIDQYRQFLDTFKDSSLFQTPLPFAGGKTIGHLVDFGSGLIDLVKKLAPGDDLTPTFSTVQELVGNLDEILGLPPGTTTIDYDSATKSFTFGLNLKTTLADVDIPFDFGTNIGPLVDLSTDGTAKLSADLAFHLVLGFDTRQLSATLKAGGDSPGDGQLSGDAHFKLGIGAAQPVDITVKASATNGSDGTAANQSVSDLVADINAALDQGRDDHRNAQARHPKCQRPGEVRQFR